jgi:pimeloyl-ACP methyl ester carboxylesterase
MVAGAGGEAIFARTVGHGRPVLMIPSLGRGAHDFDALAATLASRGFEVILPEPRGVGRSTDVSARDLFDLAADDVAVIDALCVGRVDVLGHAFGNRVARSVATAAPGRVGHVILLAGGGEAPPTPEVAAALQGSLSQGSRPDAERLADLRIAFFATGQDASAWLTGWYPQTARLERAAGAATPVARWWTAGQAPVLLIQALEDPIAPPANAAALKRDLGARLTLVALPHASHAMLPEQPRAIAAVVTAYLDGERDERRLDSLVTRIARAP